MDEEVHPHDTWTIGGRLDDLEWAVESARRQMEPDKTVGQISVDMRDDTGRSWQENLRAAGW